MKARLAVLLFLVFTALPVTPAMANDLRVYFGTRSRQTYTSMVYALEKFPTYLIVDHTTKQFTFITYSKSGTHFESTEALQIDTIVPRTPELTAASREFLYAQVGDPSVPVDVKRFRGTAKPKVTPISSTSSQLTSVTLAYTSYYFALAAYNYEETGSFSFQKALTISVNNANTDLAGATTIILDDLRRRKKIDQ